MGEFTQHNWRRLSEEVKVFKRVNSLGEHTKVFLMVYSQRCTRCGFVRSCTDESREYNWTNPEGQEVPAVCRPWQRRTDGRRG